MSKYSSLPDKPDFMHKVLLYHYDYLTENFFAFMADIMDFVSVKFQINLQKPDFAEGA